jgi:hypothetical protein
VLGRSFEVRDLPAFNVGTRTADVAPGLEAAFQEKNGLDLELCDFSVRLLDERLRRIVR